MINWLHPSTRVYLFSLYSSFLLHLCLSLALEWWQPCSPCLGSCTVLMAPLHPAHIFVNSSSVKPSLHYPNLRAYSFSSWNSHLIEEPIKRTKMGKIRNRTLNLMMRQCGDGGLERQGGLWLRHCPDSWGLSLDAALGAQNLRDRYS